MNKPRSIITILVTLIAIGCIVNVQFVRAEGPFDVDNSGGSGRGPGTTVINDPNDGDDSDGNDSALRCSTGTIGGDWITGLILRWTFEALFDADKIVVKPQSTNVKFAPVGNKATIR